ACIAPSTGSSALDSTAGRSIYVQFGENILTGVHDRILDLLRATRHRVVEAARPTASLPDDAIVLSFGTTTRGREGLDRPTTAWAEAFVLRSEIAGGRAFFYADGAGATALVDRGAQYAAYALLEQLGFAFLHPLAPLIPAVLELPKKPLDIREAPRWPV